MKFQYRDDLLAHHPDICGGVLYATHLRNGSTPPELAARYAAEQEAARTRIQTLLSEVPSLAAWRQAFRRFGANPTKYRSAAEALLRRLEKKGDIPSINTLVDIGNLVSIRYALPVAIFDARHIVGGITVHPATGDERFVELDSQQPEHPEADEVIFSDETGLVVARRWCWRQSAESAARPDTTTALVTVEAHHPGGCADIEQAVHDLSTLLTAYADASVVANMVDANQPIFVV
jgi:DNA/RNA-binding domain of Phe-tRNA-synthetase-like protein